MQWRKHLPDNCPPNDAIPTNGLVYRLAKSIVFGEQDFLSQREERPNETWDIPECQACGVSVFTELEGVKRAREISPALRKKKLIKGFLEPKHGKIKNTPSQRTHKSHHTWWIPLDSQPWNVFTVDDSLDS